MGQRGASAAWFAEIVTLQQQISFLRRPGGKRTLAPYQSVRHLLMVVDHRLFPNPIKRRHFMAKREHTKPENPPLSTSSKSENG
jgi:hypothetical protein